MLRDTEWELQVVSFIPAMTSASFKEYALTTFPVRMDHVHTRHIELVRRVAVGSDGGRSFYMRDSRCVGKGPKVCHSFAIQTALTCERALVQRLPQPPCNLVMGNYGATHKATLQLLTYQTLLVNPNVPRLRVTSTCDEEARSVSFEITKLTLVTVEPACVYTVGDYRFKGVVMGRSSRRAPCR